MNDFKVDLNGDLDFETKGNDLTAVDATLQHQGDIIWSEKGWWHFAPSLGVGLQSYLNESGTAPGLMRVIRTELEKDGARVDSVKVTEAGLEINATYTLPK